MIFTQCQRPQNTPPPELNPHLIRWHGGILGHHAMHLIPHIAVLTADHVLPLAVLETQHALAALCWVRHHSLVTWRGERNAFDSVKLPRLRMTDCTPAIFVEKHISVLIFIGSNQ